MSSTQEQLDAIKDMRKMMERSSKFLSFSGLAGIIIGLIALLGMAAFCIQFKYNPLQGGYTRILLNEDGGPNFDALSYLLKDALIVFVLSTLVECVLAYKKATKVNAPIWDQTSKRVLINLLIPFITGVIVCSILIVKNQILMLAPASLIFYGLALVNASKYSMDQIRGLGILEIILGLISMYWMDLGLICWAMGFGVLHIIYGIFIYSNNEK